MAHRVEHVLPANNARFLEKAFSSQADVLILDLEDSVAASVKSAARETLAEFLAKTDSKGKKVFLRPNNLRTKWAAGDYWHLVRAVGDKIAGVVLPKAAGPEDVDLADRILSAIEAEKGWKRGSLKLEVLIETPGAVLAAEEIARVVADSGRAGALILGLVDYTTSTGGRAEMLEDQFLYALYPKKRIIAAAQSAGLAVIDGITIRVKDYKATKKDALLSAKLGFTGKWSLHPEQVRAILDADKEVKFPSPSPLPQGARVKKENVVFPLKELERLAKEEKPLLPPLKARLKTLKARRSVWLDRSRPMPKEADEAGVFVVAVKNTAELRKAQKNFPPKAPVFLKIETLEALHQAHAMASACPAIEALIFAIPGYEDDFEAKGQLVAAASALDIDAIDAPALPGKANLTARQAAIVGFTGKVAMSAEEAKLFNSVFSPTPQAIERALDIAELYRKADVERGLGATVYVDRGRAGAQEELVDASTVRAERRVLSVAHQAGLFTPGQAKRFLAFSAELEKSQGTRSPQASWRVLATEEDIEKQGGSSMQSTIKRVSILGAGEIGAPLAARMARCGVEVCLGTIHLSTLAKAEKKISTSLEFRAKEAVGILSLQKKAAKAQGAEKAKLEAQAKELEPQARELVQRWTANIKMHNDLNYTRLIQTLTDHQPDFIIECTREEALSKQSLFRAWVKCLKDLPKAPVIATTTSSLKLSDVWTPIPDSLKPRFVGFHPFNPPDRMNLLELAHTHRTESKVLEEVKLFAKELGMEPVVVTDSCSFIVNRILFAYLGEAAWMLERGEASWEQIVGSTLEFGFPMDPFRLLDFVGLDTSEAIISNLHQSFSEHINPPSSLFKKLLSLGHEGNKSGKGFYSYDKSQVSNGTAKTWMVKLGLENEKEAPALLTELGITEKDGERLGALLDKVRAGFDAEALKLFAASGARLAGEADGFDPLRLPLVMAAEAARIVSEGVASIADVDLAMDLGIRFPEKGFGVRLAGGIFAAAHEKSKASLKALHAKSAGPRLFASGPWGWLLQYGVEKAVDRLEALEKIHGPLYKPAQILRDLRFGRLPKPGADGKFQRMPYKRVFVKPKGVAGPATEVLEEGIVPTQKQLGAYQMRARVIVADINANWKWGVRDYPIDLSRYHTETGTVGGSTALVMITEVGPELIRVGTVKAGDIGIMLCGKHDVITLEALGGSAQANRSFRIHGYEAKDPVEGSYGQEVVLDWSQFVTVDEGAYSFEELGGAGLVYPTVQHAWNVLNLRGNTVILVEGAVGGTGSTAALTAKSRGAKVIGMVSSEARAKTAREKYGCDETIDRTKFQSDEAYVAEIRRLVKNLTNREGLLEKVLAYSGQGMFAKHFLSLRESDPSDGADLGGELTYFGAGETGFALEVPGTAGHSPVKAMFKRIARVRTLRYRTSSMRYVLVVVGENLEETKEAVIEAKRRHCDVIVVAENAKQAEAVKNLNALATAGRWPKTPCRDGIVDLSAIGVKLEKMPEPPVILPDNPTPAQAAEFEAKGKEYAAYMRRSLIPFGKALGAIWGLDATGRPIPTDAAIVLRNDQAASDILNYITFTSFFGQIAFPKDTSKLRLRWHAALGWMNQNSILFSTRAILGSHYASPNESAAIIDWLMRGVVPPAETTVFAPARIGEAQETIGTGKNTVLIGAPRPGLKTVKAAYASQEVAPSIASLTDADPAIREMAAERIYAQGFEMAEKAAALWRSDKELNGLILDVPIVGVAVEPDRFDAAWKAWGSPEPAQTPPEQSVREFTLQTPGAILDVLAPTGAGALEKFLRTMGEGIQQIEFAVTDVAKVTELLRQKGIQPVYEAPRPGANGTLVNFFLLEVSPSEKALVEFFQLQPGAKSGLQPFVMKDSHIRMFAKASGDRNPFHLDDAYAAKTSYGVRIAHGVLTAGIVASKLSEFCPGYAVESLQVSRFISAVKIGDTVKAQAEVLPSGDVPALKISAVNQEGKPLLEGTAALKPLRSEQVRRPVSWTDRTSQAVSWARDIRAFAVRPAPNFSPQQKGNCRAEEAESRCLKITEDTLKAYGVIFGGTDEEISNNVVVGAVAHTSALFAPGYILAGFRSQAPSRVIQEGEALNTQATVTDIQRTGSGKLLVKIAIEVKDSSGETIAQGEVTKIKVEVGEPQKEEEKDSSKKEKNGKSRTKVK